MSLTLAEELQVLSDLYRTNDPIGAQKISRAARMLGRLSCPNCSESRRLGYADGYRIGYRRGVNEWQEGLQCRPTSLPKV